MLLVAGIAVLVATGGVLAGDALLELIRLATNIAYFGRFSFADLKIDKSPLGCGPSAGPRSGPGRRCRGCRP